MVASSRPSPVRILGPDGNPMPPSRRGPLALNGNSYVPYDAADRFGSHMGAWNPILWSADTALNPFRDTIVARVRDAVANDGWASGAVTRILDNAIGAKLRPISKPHWRTLQQITGNTRFDQVWAREYGAAVEGYWKMWADGSGKWCDATGNQTFSQMAHTAFRHGLVDGDALALIEWKPANRSPGRARYSTAVRLIDPDRLSNPSQSFDTLDMRGGVEINSDGRTVAYHIRKAHQGDWYAGAQSYVWERCAREDAFGRQSVVHYFETHRAGQHRGGAGIFTPILERLKMLIKYDSTELDAAIVNAIFAAYIESPMDPQLVKEAMGAGEEVDENFSLNGYQADRQAWARENALLIGGARMPHLYPGEAIKTVAAERPSSNFSAFENSMLRNIASGLGLSAQQVSNDWSDVNYSSARSAALEAGKTMARRQHDFFVGFATPIWVAVHEEIWDRERLPMPGGAIEDFINARDAYAGVQWVGPPKGWVNPVDERAGAILGMDAGLSTLELECLQQGHDFLDVLHQRKYELELFDELGIPRPEWAGLFTASQAATKPQKPDAQ